MDTTQIKSGRTMVLSREDVLHSAAFEIKSSQRDSQGALYRVLASSFLKYCEPSKALFDADSSESFVALYQLHQVLSEQAEQFLQQEMPFVRDNRPINELLLNFASFRLTQASRAYYFESLTARDTEEVESFKQKVRDCQKDFDNLIQAL